MTTYSPEDDLDKGIDEKTRDIMLDVILQWARYDSLVSQWVILAFGMTLDSGAILLGNMDTRTKLDRLKALYQHHGMDESVAGISRLQTAHKKHVDVRNAIAHYTCGGRWKSDPERIVFAPVKPFKGTVGHMLVEHLHLDQMKAATRFAESAANRLMDITEVLATQRPAPSEAPPPSGRKSRLSPQESAKRKRPPPPSKRKG